MASTARQKSKVKSQKSKVLWNKLFRAFQWSAYLRRAVLVLIIVMAVRSPKLGYIALLSCVKYKRSSGHSNAVSATMYCIQARTAIGDVYNRLHTLGQRKQKHYSKASKNNLLWIKETLELIGKIKLNILYIKKLPSQLG